MKFQVLTSGEIGGTQYSRDQQVVTSSAVMFQAFRQAERMGRAIRIVDARPDGALSSGTRGARDFKGRNSTSGLSLSDGSMPTGQGAGLPIAEVMGARGALSLDPSSSASVALSGNILVTTSSLASGIVRVDLSAGEQRASFEIDTFDPAIEGLTPLNYTAVLPIIGNSQVGNGSSDDQAATLAAVNYQPTPNIRILNAAGALVTYNPGVAGSSGLQSGANTTGVGPALGVALWWQANRLATDQLVIVSMCTGGSFQGKGTTTGAANLSVASNNVLTINSGTVTDNTVFITANNDAAVKDQFGNNLYRPSNGFVRGVGATSSATGVSFSNKDVAMYNGLVSWSVTSGLLYLGHSGQTSNAGRARLANVMTLLAGENPKMIGLGLVLGGNEATDAGAAAEMLPETRAFITRIRADFPDLVTAPIVQFYCRGNAAYSSIVRNAQMTIAASDPNVYLLGTSHWPLSADGVHWRITDGLIKGGQAICDIIFKKGEGVPQMIEIALGLGDSNGRGQAANENELVWAADSGITTWTGSAWAVMQPGVRTRMTVPGALAGSEGRFGPLCQMARAFRAENPAKPFGTIDGCRAGAYQSYTAGAPVNGDAGNSFDASSGTLTTNVVSNTNTAVAALVALGYIPRITAVDILGTNDAGNGTTAPLVQAAKIAMHAALRAITAWSAGQSSILVQRMKADSPQPQLATVRTAQATVANSAADVHMVSTDSFSNNPGDLTHYDLAGLIACGNALYAAFKNRVNRRSAGLGTDARYLADFDNADNLIASGGFIGSIRDSIGNKVLSQANAAKQPAQTTIAGKGAADFDGGDTLAVGTGSGWGNGDWEAGLIVTNDRGGADAVTGVIFGWGGGSNSNTDARITRPASTTEFRAQVGTGGANYAATTTGANAAGGGVFMIWARYVSATNTLYVRVNNGQEFSGAVTGAMSLTDAAMFMGSANDTSFWHDGKIRLVTVTGALSDVKRLEAANDLMVEAGLLAA